MKVSISVGGRFHAFDLAGSLEKNGLLHELITSYPVFVAVRFGIPRKKVKSILIKELAERFFRKFLKREFPKPISANLYDWLASFRFDFSSDVYIIWSSYALHSIRKIRKKNPGAIIILERGSAHIAVQNNLLIQSGIKYPIYPSIIRKEIEEYNLADFISLPGQFAKRTFIEQGINPKKIVINPYGVDLEGFPLGPAIKDKTVFTVGYVGSMSTQKNVMGLINACRYLVQQGIALRLLLIGGIDHGTFNPKKLESEPWIDYLGPKPQSELPSYYHKMDIFVLNSIQDGFGMVILQALSCGVPVIGTENTGAPDVIKENWNGFIIPIWDDQKLTEKISYLIQYPEKLTEMKIHARKSVLSGFSWTDYGNRYSQFLLALPTRKM